MIHVVSGLVVIQFLEKILFQLVVYAHRVSLVVSKSVFAIHLIQLYSLKIRWS